MRNKSGGSSGATPLGGSSRFSSSPAALERQPPQATITFGVFCSGSPPRTEGRGPGARRLKSCPQCGVPFGKPKNRCLFDGTALADTPPDPLLGRTLGRYTIDQHLGDGAMARVYRARHEVLETYVALKVLFGEIASTPALLKRFVREARACSRMAHPNLLRVLDLEDNGNGLAYMVMEYAPGRTLDQLRRREPFGLERVLNVAQQVASGLAAAHEAGFVHHDIKPSNLMLHEEDGRESVKILDFGLTSARVGTDEDVQALTQQGQLLGSPRYMAPEQILGQRGHPQSDLYSLGVVLFELVEGRPPFPGKDVKEVWRKHVTESVPAMKRAGPLEPLIQALMAKALEDRIPSGAALVERIETLRLRHASETMVRAPTGDLGEATLADRGRRPPAPLGEDTVEDDFSEEKTEFQPEMAELVQQRTPASSERPASVAFSGVAGTVPPVASLPTLPEDDDLFDGIEGTMSAAFPLQADDSGISRSLDLEPKAAQALAPAPIELPRARSPTPGARSALLAEAGRPPDITDKPRPRVSPPPGDPSRRRALYGLAACLIFALGVSAARLLWRRDARAEHAALAPPARPPVAPPTAGAPSLEPSTSRGAAPGAGHEGASAAGAPESPGARAVAAVQIEGEAWRLARRETKASLTEGLEARGLTWGDLPDSTQAEWRAFSVRPSVQRADWQAWQEDTAAKISVLPIDAALLSRKLKRVNVALAGAAKRMPPQKLRGWEERYIALAKAAGNRPLESAAREKLVREVSELERALVSQAEATGRSVATMD